MKKIILLTSIGLLLLVGVISLDTTQARADNNQNGGNNQNQNGREDYNNGGNNQNQNSGVITLTHTINASDLVNTVVIGPVTTPIFTMVFNTTSDYSGTAQFQIEQNDGTWVPIGIKQIRGFTIVDGVDAIPAAHIKIPLTVRVVVVSQTVTGSSYAELDYVGSQQTNQNTGGDKDNDNDNDEGNDQDQQSDGWNNQNQQQH
jgi:hypothetical protein